MIEFLWEKFLNFPWRVIYSLIKTVIILLDILLVIIFIFVLIKVRPLRPDLNFKTREKKKKEDLQIAIFREKWYKILSKIDKKQEGSFALAVIEIDNLVDEFLKIKNIKGDNFGERIKNLRETGLYSWAKLWEAHKIRNTLVHSHDSPPSLQELQAAIKNYEDFWKEVKVL